MQANLFSFSVIDHIATLDRYKKTASLALSIKVSIVDTMPDVAKTATPTGSKIIIKKSLGLSSQGHGSNTNANVKVNSHSNDMGSEEPTFDSEPLSDHPSYYFYPSAPKAFKNPNFSSNIGSKKKWKNLKAVYSALANEASQNKYSLDQPTCKSIDDIHAYIYVYMSICI